MLRRIALMIASVALLLAACGGDDSETAQTESRETPVTTGGGTTSGADTGEDPPPPPPRCEGQAGTVKGYVPVIERDACDPRDLLRGAALYDADQVTTGPSGQLQFEAGRFDLCTTWPGTVLVLRPDADTLLRLVSGTIACSAQPGVAGERIESPGAEIEVRGTLFTLAATGEETTIKVHEGTLVVRTTVGSGDATEVREFQQVVATEGQEPIAGEYSVDRVETERITALRLGVISLPSEALPEFTAGAAAGDVTLVTETDGQAQVLLERGVVPNSRPVTTSSLRQRSARGLGLRGQTVVGVGSFSELAEAFAQLRLALGPGATLVYTPYAFPEESSETTPTETGETIETGPTPDTTATGTTETPTP